MKELDELLQYFKSNEKNIKFISKTTENYFLARNILDKIMKLSLLIQQDFPFISNRLMLLKNELFSYTCGVDVVIFGRIFELLILLKSSMEQKNDDRWKYIHPVLLQGQTKEKFQYGFYSDAVFTATNILRSRLKAMFHEADPQAKELDGSPLIENLMSEKAPKIMFSEGNTLLDKDLQRGYGALFKGWILAVRNQKAHGVTDTLTEEDAFQELVLISMLMKALDKSSVVIVQSQQADS